MITTTPLRQTTTPVWQAISLAPFVEILRVGECPVDGVVGRSYVSGYGDHVSFGEARVDTFIDHSVTIDGTCAVMGGGRSPAPNETRADSLVPDETRVSCTTIPFDGSRRKWHGTEHWCFVFQLFRTSLRSRARDPPEG